MPPSLTPDEKRATAIVVLLFFAIVAGLVAWEIGEFLSLASRLVFPQGLNPSIPDLLP